MTPKMTRRSFVTVAGGALVALSACAKDDGTAPDEPAAPTDEPAGEPDAEPEAEPEGDADPSPAVPATLTLSSLRYHEDDQGFGDVDTLSETTYDDQGRLARKVLQNAAVHVTIDYDYDDQGRVCEAVVTQQDEYQVFAGTWTCEWSDDGLDASWTFSPADGVTDFEGFLEVSYNDDGTVFSKRGKTPGPQNYFEGSANYTYGESGQVESVTQRSGEAQSQYEQSWITWLAYDAAGRLAGYRDTNRDRAIRWQYDDENSLVYLEARAPFTGATYAETFMPSGEGMQMAWREVLSGDASALLLTPPADGYIDLDSKGHVEGVTIRFANGSGAEYEATYSEVPSPDGTTPTPVASLLDPLQPALAVDDWMWLDDYPLFGVDEALRANRAWLAQHADEVAAILENRASVRATVLETGAQDETKVLYAEPIAAYSKATAGELDWSSSDYYASWLAMSYTEQVGEGGFEYAFCDLDRDGQPEMLVRPVMARTMDVWRLDEHKPVLVLSGGFFEGEPQRIEVCEDGYAILSGASGLAEDCWTLMRLEGTEAVSETMVYGDGTMGYTRMDYDTGAEMQVSEGEYLKLYAEHPVLLGLKWVAIEAPVG